MTKTHRTAAFLREQIALCAQYYMQVRPGSRDAAATCRDQQAFRDELAKVLRDERRVKGLVTESEIQAGREHIADVHNTTQMLSACGQLRREVVMEMAARGLVPDFYAKDQP